MVRLRTDRWYSSDGQQRSRSRVTQQLGGSRRVLSLCFLLALVVLLMQQAADPRHVRNAFQALGVPLDAAPATQLPSSQAPAAHLPRSEPAAAATPWETTCRDVLPRLLDQLTGPELTAAAQVWFGERPTAESSVSGVWPQAERANAILDALAEETRTSTIDQADKMAWLAQLEKFRSQWQLLGNHPSRNQLSPAISPELQSAITAYLDRQLLSSLRDASPWTAAETMPFWRLLQRGQGRGGDAASRAASYPTPIVNTLQLTAEAAALRGTLVRFRGSVRRVDTIHRSYPPLGLEGGYWILWLRGLDAAVQPVAVYTTDPLAAKLAQQFDPTALDFPELEVTAIAAKRLAYAAESGVQVAPTLFATSLTSINEPLPAGASASNTELWRQFSLALLGACLLAAALIVPIAWQRGGFTRRPARRAAGRRARPETSAAAKNSAAGDLPRNSGQVFTVVLIVTLPLSCAGLLTATIMGAADEQPFPVRPAMSSLLNPVLAPARLIALQSADVQTQQPPTQPPWVSQAQADPLQGVFVENMQNLFDSNSLMQLRHYQSQRGGSFPDALLKTLHAVRRIGWQRALTISAPVELSDETWLRSTTLSGWVRLAAPVFLDDSQRSWFQLHDQEQLYRIELQLQSDLFEPASTAAATAIDATVAGSTAKEQIPSLVTVYCQQVPAAWLATAQLRQPAQFKALTFEDVDGSAIAWCALAAAPEWRLPAAIKTVELVRSLAPPLSEQQLELGLLGWNLMHLNAVVAHHQQPLADDEADGFYSLIRLVGDNHNSVSLWGRDKDTVSNTAPLKTLSQARESLGKEINWPVRIVSGTLVTVDNPHHRQELGAEGYIQFDGFVDIGRDRIHFQPATSGQQPAAAVEFEGEFPITIVSSLETPLISRQAIAAGVRSWEIGQYATLQGRFYRLWAYQSDAVKSRGQTARQIAPLVIAARIVPGPPPLRSETSAIGWFGWALCAATLVILGGILWSTASGLKPRKRLTR